MLSDLGQELTIAINLDVPVEEVTMRMMARGREDDTEEAIARRLSLYEEQTAPLLDWFAERGLLATVDGLGEEDQVFSRLTEAIDGRMA
jgi:adenylate kinase